MKTKNKIKKTVSKFNPAIPTPEEYEKIVEFSFNAKALNFVVRFLSGESYSMNVQDLPKAIQAKSPDWSSLKIDSRHSGFTVSCKGGIMEIPAFVIHSRGRLIK
jgi:hypothetical protein